MRSLGALPPRLEPPSGVDRGLGTKKGSLGCPLIETAVSQNRSAEARWLAQQDRGDTVGRYHLFVIGRRPSRRRALGCAERLSIGDDWHPTPAARVASANRPVPPQGKPRESRTVCLVLLAAFAVHVTVLDFFLAGFPDFGDFDVEVQVLTG